MPRSLFQPWQISFLKKLKRKKFCPRTNSGQTFEHAKKRLLSWNNHDKHKKLLINRQYFSPLNFIFKNAYMQSLGRDGVLMSNICHGYPTLALSRSEHRSHRPPASLTPAAIPVGELCVTSIIVTRQPPGKIL